MQSPLAAFWLRPRLLAALALGAGLGLFLPIASLPARLLVAWCVSVVAYIALIGWQFGRASPDAIRKQASRLDDSATVISLFAILAASASLGAVAMLVAGQGAAKGTQIPDVLLAGATMVCAWAFIQTVFTVHYAHVFYGDDADGRSRGGLDFNSDEDPDFWDFLYFTVTIGATSQTSDVDITSKRLRRIVTAQAAYSFVFNTSILALAVNMAAGFAQK